jgi:hypothetical protein
MLGEGPAGFQYRVTESSFIYMVDVLKNHFERQWVYMKKKDGHIPDRHRHAFGEDVVRYSQFIVIMLMIYNVQIVYFFQFYNVVIKHVVIASFIFSSSLPAREDKFPILGAAVDVLSG